MNKLTRTSALKKLAVLMTVTGVSSLISLPVMAQLNPRPRIFDEPPYNRLQSPPKHHHPKHKHDPRLGERPAPPSDAGDRPPKHHHPKHKRDPRIGERPAPPDPSDRPPKHDRPRHRLDPRIGERPAPPPVENAPQPAGGRSYDFRPAPPPPAATGR